MFGIIFIWLKPSAFLKTLNKLSFYTLTEIRFLTILLITQDLNKIRKIWSTLLLEKRYKSLAKNIELYGN